MDQGGVWLHQSQVWQTDRQTDRVPMKCLERDGKGVDSESHGEEPGEQRVPWAPMEGPFQASRPRRRAAFLSGSLGRSALPTPSSHRPPRGPWSQGRSGLPGAIQPKLRPRARAHIAAGAGVHLASKDLPLVFWNSCARYCPTMFSSFPTRPPPGGSAWVFWSI